MNRMMPAAVFLAALICLGPRAAAQETVKLTATKDASVSSNTQERDLNWGAAERLKVKYLEEMGLVTFDLTPLAASASRPPGSTSAATASRPRRT